MAAMLAGLEVSRTVRVRMPAAIAVRIAASSWGAVMGPLALRWAATPDSVIARPGWPEIHPVSVSW